MKYYLQSHALGFSRLFESLDEVEEYLLAQTGAQYFDMGFVKEYLKTDIKYTYTGWGIDLSIYRKRVTEESIPTNRQELNDKLL